jgi:diguanylate cyclase (GGDEF)-like protein
MSIPSTPQILPPPTTFDADGGSVPSSPMTARIGAALTRWSRQGCHEPEAALDLFADFLAGASGSALLDETFLAIAWKVAGPGVREIVLTHGDGRVVRDSLRLSPTVPVSTDQFAEFPLRLRGRSFGSLRVVFEGTEALGPERYRRLTTLTVLAAAAELADVSSDSTKARSPSVAPNATHDPATGFPNAAFLTPFLSYTLALSDRRREPVSLLSVGVDRLSAIRELHGHDFADMVIGKIGRIIAGTLRTSDLVARLDDGCLVAVLPGASSENALKVAESLRGAIAVHGIATTKMPLLTASIGVATYPDHAGDPVALRSSAAAALVEARACGRNCVVAASALPDHKTTLLRLSDPAD